MKLELIPVSREQFKEIITEGAPVEREGGEASYHGRIMNIAAKDFPTADFKKAYEYYPEVTNAPEVKLAYKYGHRDARHAAAEIANEADTRIAELEAHIAGLTQNCETYHAELEGARKERNEANARAAAAEKHAERMQITVDSALEETEKAIAERNEARSYALRENFANNPIVAASGRTAEQYEKRMLAAEARAADLVKVVEAYPEWTDDDADNMATTQRFVTCIVCEGGGAFNADGKPSKQYPPTHKPDCVRQSALRQEGERE